VTGAAGFIGSTLCEKLLELGHDVVGVDCFVPYYPRQLKERNLEKARQSPKFQLLEVDLCDLFASPTADGTALLQTIDVIYHQAAQAGVRASWGKDFEIYTHNNILATQKMLEACKQKPGIRVVYASSSSVYGETDRFPMRETDLTRPVSPYGVSKLAAENLMCLYHHNFGVETVSLRYFTVYGPRQRPDMAFHRIIRSILTGETFHLFGSGNQTRDFTYVGDIVDANIQAGEKGKPGTIYNLGGGTRISMNDVIALMERIAGKQANVVKEAVQLGDVTNTGADVSRANEDFGFAPKISLEEGLAKEVDYIRELLAAEVSR
jgi:UDP-glucose 4-epimerase